MAPTKRNSLPKQSTSLVSLTRKGLSKRAQYDLDQNVEVMPTRGKRKAENSPLYDKIKRSALGNLTNNVNTLHLDDGVKELVKDKIANIKKKEKVIAMIKPTNLLIPKDNKDQQNGGQPPARQTKMITRATTRNNISVKIEENQINNAVCTSQSTLKASATAQKEQLAQSLADQKYMKPPTRRISDEFNKTEESLYMSALEDISNSESLRLSLTVDGRRCSTLKNTAAVSSTLATNLSIRSPSPINVQQIPPDVLDFDKANLNDPFQVSHYAMDIFNYLKQREPEFIISDYMPKQVHLTKWMRSLLVDWMVEVQETFELNHETLYLAVKIVDLFLCKVVINKDKLQLLGAAALFIACKFDERTPPYIEDFLYICDGAYKHEELVKMEMTALKTINFDLGIPLSYRFLRRYARCAKVPMPILTLARYILELSLMDYATISLSDSKLAAAALFMALRMHGEKHPWGSCLEYYTGYQLEEFADIVPLLNAGLHRKPKGTIKTIKSKYSHKIFQEAAKVPLMSTEKLFEHTKLYSTSIQ